jgi:cardiolipin synthase
MKLRRYATVLFAAIALLLLSYGLIDVSGSSKQLAVTASSRNALTAAADNSFQAASDKLSIEPDDGTATVLSLIQSATSSIDLVMYELADPTIEQALATAEKRGVAVRVLLNEGYYGAASKTNTNESAYEYLQSNNVPVEWTSSSFALTHEKSLVVDDKQALIMTYNLDPQYYATSRDFGVLDEDSADVAAMSETFDDDWSGTMNTPNNGDDLVWSPGAEDGLLAMINGAQKTLEVYTEEMNDEDVAQALIAAEKRGVQVRIVMTYSSEWKSDFDELTAAGVNVRTFADSTKAPVYIHAKMIVADGTYVFLGSQNFSSTSLTKNRELGLIISNPSMAASLDTVFEGDWSNATPYTLN